jgi:hypothetical protein
VKVLQAGVSAPKLGAAAATERNFALASLAGADGVVHITEALGTTPCVRAEAAIAASPCRTATPPNLRGDSPRSRLSRLER